MVADPGTNRKGLSLSIGWSKVNYAPGRASGPRHQPHAERRGPRLCGAGELTPAPSHYGSEFMSRFAFLSTIVLAIIAGLVMLFFH
jgi:hypothetical protein